MSVNSYQWCEAVHGWAGKCVAYDVCAKRTINQIKHTPIWAHFSPICRVNLIEGKHQNLITLCTVTGPLMWPGKVERQVQIIQSTKPTTRLYSSHFPKIKGGNIVTIPRPQYRMSHANWIIIIIGLLWETETYDIWIFCFLKQNKTKQKLLLYSKNLNHLKNFIYPE